MTLELICAWQCCSVRDAIPAEEYMVCHRSSGVQTLGIFNKEVQFNTSVLLVA